MSRVRVLDAARALVRRFPGGIAAVAVRIPRTDGTGRCKSEEVLRQELSGNGSHKLGLEDSELITLMAVEQRVVDPLAIINAMASNVGAMVVMLPACAVGDEMTLTGLALFARESADVMTVMA